MKAVCFTGHRKLPKDVQALSQRLYRELEREIK